MNFRKHISIYAALILAFLCFKLTENSWNYPNWFHSYFEDLLAMPIFLKTALIILQSLHEKWRFYTISTFDLVLITALTSVYFEWILPLFDNRFTNDLLDILMYSIGTIFFAFLLNNPFKVGKPIEAR